jgi:DNA sulfur modification protein DndD
MVARSASVGAGNRRRLFGQFDDLLSSPEFDGLGYEHHPGTEAYADHAVVRMRRLRLRNWRLFERAELLFADGGPEHPLFIVGGRNGFGKSSLLEAFAFGLFGRRALADLGALFGSPGTRGTVRRSYGALMERVLHRSRRAREQGSCAVRLDFDTATGPVEIERKWYFNDEGRLIEEDEELFVHVGSDRNLLCAPVGANAFTWLQEEVERRIMPVQLSPFFMFDGEQIERWADRRLSDQVRSAIERALGLREMADLATDLREYAQDRERGFAGQDAASAERLRERVDHLKATIASARNRLAATEATIAEERRHRDSALVALAVTSSHTHADLQTSLERTHALELELKRLRRELGGVLTEVGPFALVGATLSGRIADEVEEEGSRMSASELDRAGFELLWSRFAGQHPPLDRSVAKAMRARLERAWSAADASHAPPPRHLHLGGTDHRIVAARLRTVGGQAIERVATLRGLLDSTLAELARVVSEREAGERRTAERVHAREELAEIAGRLEKAEEQRRSIEREVSLLEAALEPDLLELARREEQLAALAPRTRGAAAARRVADALETSIVEQSSAEYNRFAAAVGESFRRLSHKNQIARIAIGADGTVSLFDAAGDDITDFRLSAGESQLFAIALITAVSAVTGRELPLIVDTPLSRLDTEHRAGVLRMLAERRGQTILLTQPEEIGRHHLAALGPAIAGAVTITHELSAASGVGVSDFTDGYLEEVAA